MILVLGTGRSGTSTVARLLHTELGVSMGTRFRDPDSANPKGYYEDLDFQEMHVNTIWDYDRRASLVDYLFEIRKGLWGFKDPRTPYFWRIYREHIGRDTKIIIATRAVHQIVISLRKNYGWSEKDSLNIIRERREGIVQLTQGYDHLTIDFTDRRSDSEVTRILTNYVR